MKVFITGSGGQLGEQLVRSLNSSHDVIGFPREELDITKPDRVQQTINDGAPEVVVNTAAYTDVDGAEGQSRKAFLTNSIAVKNLVQAARTIDSKLIHVSTDYVFDGRQNQPYTVEDPTRPRNTYGISKLAGEYFVRNYRQGCVIRSSGLYGGPIGKHNNFINNILHQTEQQDRLTVVDDQWLSPTWTRSIAEAINQAITREITGLFHFTSRGQCTWKQFTEQLLELLELTIPVEPIASERFDRPADRPEYSVLQISPELGVSPPPWEQMLEEYIEQNRPVFPISDNR